MIKKMTNFRIIEQLTLSIPCYFYGYFKAPGLNDYPNLPWINDDYDLIKSKTLDEKNCLRIANHLFILGNEFNLFDKIDYFIMMPLKTSSVSSLEKIILKLIAIIENNLAIKIKFISKLFFVEDYRKFWENRLQINARKTEIANKIKLRQEYHDFFSNKKIMIIDDVVSTGVSLAEVTLILKKFNYQLDVTALTYGSVYQWEKIYF